MKQGFVTNEYLSSFARHSASCASNNMEQIVNKVGKEKTSHGS